MRDFIAVANITNDNSTKPVTYAGCYKADNFTSPVYKSPRLSEALVSVLYSLHYNTTTLYIYFVCNPKVSRVNSALACVYV